MSSSKQKAMRSVRLEIIAWSALLLGLFLINTGYTSADLFAERNVHAKATATTLSMGVLNTANNKKADRLFDTTDMVPEGFDVGALRVKKLGKMDFTYRISPVQVAGDQAFCDALDIEVWKKTEVVYTGTLSQLHVDSTITTTKPDDWVFFVKFDHNDPSLKNKSCTFDIRFKTYRGTDIENTHGFYSRSFIHNTITSGTW